MTAEPVIEGDDVPALFVNRFNVLTGPVVTRIAFGEALVGLDARFRTAIVMRTEDAKELASLINKLIEQADKE